MKKTYKTIIQIYHLVLFSNLRSCRFEPTCSQYLLDSVEKYGSINGLMRAILRVFSCHPFTKRPIVDPA